MISTDTTVCTPTLTHIESLMCYPSGGEGVLTDFQNFINLSIIIIVIIIVILFINDLGFIYMNIHDQQ